MMTPIAEGGTAETNRWSSFSQVAGHYLSCVRNFELSLDEAAQRTLGWMMSNMVPPWPAERFKSEFTALLQLEVKNHGRLPSAPLTPAAVPALDTADDLRAFAVHRWMKATPEPRRFLVPGLVWAEKRHLLASEGGAGKTFLMMGPCAQGGGMGARAAVDVAGAAVDRRVHGRNRRACDGRGR
ncbi:MAG: hypothetical protein WDO24_20690 [Pseudomonadota bacterium]